METAAEGFMRRKVMAVEEALEAGTPRAIVADANAEEPVVSALDGGGTHVLASALDGRNGDRDETGGADRTDASDTNKRTEHREEDT